MFEPMGLPDKLRTAIASTLAVITLVLLLLLGLILLSRAINGAQQTSSTASWSLASTDSPNMVTNAFAASANALNTTVSTTRNAVDGTTAALSGAAAQAGRFSVSVVSGTGHFIGASLFAVVSFIGSSLHMAATFVGSSLYHVANFSLHCYAVEFRLLGSSLHLPAAFVHLLGHTASVDALIMPAATATTQPIINAPTGSAGQPAALLATANQPQVRPQWPIHGVITTEFGVPEPPYQPIHTGIDISDGKPAGITPIHPVMAGRVIQVIHERIKLGNEVVISHGHGLTSVYGHMHVTSVKVGQWVTQDTTLGYEGSTGVSTGPHVHLEIRLHGVPQNPHHYISGQP